MMDYAHEQADKELKRLEKRLKKEYSKAAAEAHQKAREYLDGFSEHDKALLEQVKSGKMAKAEYLKWRSETLARGQQWQDVTKQMVSDYMNANQIAAEMITDHSAGVYATNFNFGTFEAEKASLINTSFTLYDKNTVRKLITEQPDLLPSVKNMTNGKTKRWLSRKLNSIATQSILQGDSIDRIASRVAKETGQSNLHSAVRTARTMTTSAENAGRVDSYKRAKAHGIEMQKEWLATEDNRTRDSHLALNGKTADVDGFFKIGLKKLKYPGDPEGDPSEVYNCRCTLIGAFKKADFTNATTDSDLINEDFEEWAVER
jgi:SPP1 gp7 family putative phage head morphogenesis protein